MVTVFVKKNQLLVKCLRSKDNSSCQSFFCAKKFSEKVLFLASLKPTHKIEGCSAFGGYKERS